MANYMDADNNGVPDLAPETGTLVGAPTDAKNRALRTFAQGIGIDVAIAILLFVFPIINSNEFDFSKVEWSAIGLSLAKTVVQTIVAYLMRKLKVSPKTTTA